MKRKNRNLYVLTTLLLLIISYSGSSMANTEVAAYQTLLSEKQFEIRKYEKLVIAIVAQQNGVSNYAFRELFRYISGNNYTRQKIAMTAPVFMSSSSANVPTMAFILPSNLSLNSAPKPINQLIHIEETKPTVYATVSFNGYINANTTTTQIRRLQAWMEQHRLKKQGEAIFAGYDSPFIPPKRRRNEILVPIEYQF